MGFNTISNDKSWDTQSTINTWTITAVSLECWSWFPTHKTVGIWASAKRRNCVAKAS